MSGIILRYLIILALLIVAELVYFRVADRFNIIDKPNLRGSSTRVTLRGGGIVFLFGAWLWAAFFGFGYPWFLTGLTLVAAVSFADDIRPTPNALRLVVQFVAMFMMFYDLGILQWRFWWLIPIVWIVCVGIMNAFNFMDGINGMTGGYSLAVLLPLLLVDWPDRKLLVVITLSVLVFCFFNFRKKAKCFAGDVGAVSISFIILFALGRLIFDTGDVCYLMLLAVYGVDTVLTIIHRILLHEHLGQAHRKHAYQLMANELKMPHVLVSTIYMVLQLAVSAGLLFLPVNHYVYSVAVLVLLCGAYVLFMKKYYHLHEEYLRTVVPPADPAGHRTSEAE